MRQSLLLAAAVLAGSSAAQTITMLLPGQATAGVALGSVVGSEKDKTTYSITCGDSEKKVGFCQFGVNCLITTASSTIAFKQTMPYQGSSSKKFGTTVSDVVDFTCSSTDSAVMTCTGGMFQMEGSKTLQSMDLSEVVDDLAGFMHPVTLTSQLPGGASPAPTGTGGAQAGGASGNSNPPATTSSTPNAGPRATQNAVIAGVAALVGGVAML